MTLLRVEGIIKRYGKKAALRNVTLEVDKGESLVLLGPNGAGKSTLLGIMAGRLRPTEGRVEIDGEDSRKSVAARRLTGYLAHASLCYPGLTARENLVFYSRMYGVDNPADRSEEMLHLVGLWHRRDDTTGSFSRGMNQRLAIARALLHDPVLILLDEPFSGLDYQASLLLSQTLDKLRDDKRAIVLASHDMDAVERLGDKVAVLDKGQLLFNDNITPDVRSLYVELLEGSIK